MKRFLHGLMSLSILFGLIVLSEIIHVDIVILIIGATLVFIFTGWLKINANFKKSSAERDDYEKFLDDNYCEYYRNYENKAKNIEELKLCNKFLENNPKNYEALTRKAFLLFKLKKYQESIEVYKIVTNKNKHDSESFLNYAQCYYYLGDEKKAFKVIDSFCIFEDVGSRYNYYAEMYKNLKLYDKSVKEYTSAINLRPDCEHYYSDRAEVYKLMKQYDKAIEDYTEAIEMDKNYSFFYEYRAKVYKLMGQYDKAIEDYTKAIELESKSDFGCFYYEDRAKVYAIIKNYDKAIADLKRHNEGLDISNDDDNYYQNEIERYQYEWFLECNNFDILADDYESEENTLKELELCNKFLQENPDNRYAIKQKAELYFRLEKYEEALNIYKALSEKESEYIVSVAMCYYALGEKEKALKIVKDYYQGRNEDDVYYADIAKMNKIAKEYKEAIENYTSAINCKPNFPYYYRSRAEIYKILNEQDKYKADMKKYKELKKEYDYSKDIEDNKDDNSSKEEFNKNLKP